MLSNPVILVPGITATYLRDQYPLPPETLWSVTTKNFSRVQPHPDNINFEAQEPAIVRPGQIYEIAYEELVEELRHDLSPDPDKPVPVFPFGYDWRHALDETEKELDAFIDEVIERTKLLRHYHREKDGDAPKVNLVGHSMGGLVIAGYIERFGGRKLGKVVSLASPFRGSFEAIVKMATGTGNWGGSVPKSRERKAARLTPALYHLLPNFDTGIKLDQKSSLPTDIFKRALWQRSIINTVVEYVKKYGVKQRSSRVARADGIAMFETLLADAKAHRSRLERLDLEAKNIDPSCWLCVIGVGAETRVRMRVKNTQSGPQFLLTSKDRMDEWDPSPKEDSEEETARQLTGDGTVHFAGARPNFLLPENLVCVSPDDFGTWEGIDRATTSLAGFHGILPNMNMLHRMIVRFFRDEPDRRQNTWGRPAPGVPINDWKPPLKLRARVS